MSFSFIKELKCFRSVYVFLDHFLWHHPDSLTLLVLHCLSYIVSFFFSGEVCKQARACFLFCLSIIFISRTFVTQVLYQPLHWIGMTTLFHKAFNVLPFLQISSHIFKIFLLFSGTFITHQHILMSLCSNRNLISFHIYLLQTPNSQLLHFSYCHICCTERAESFYFRCFKLVRNQHLVVKKKLGLCQKNSPHYQLCVLT